MKIRRGDLAVRVALSFGVLPGSLAAATWTVCPAGGGCSFTDIQSAIDAASPGDTILVLPGSYPAFVLEKGLRILGVDPSLVTVSMTANPPSPFSPPVLPATVRVNAIPAGQFALLAGMTIQVVTSPPLPYSSVFCSGNPVAALAVSNCAGAVTLSNLNLQPGHYSHGIRAEGNAAVLADHVQVSASQIVGSVFSPTCYYYFGSYSGECPRAGVFSAATALSLNSSSVLGMTSSSALVVEGSSSSHVAGTDLTGADGTGFAAVCIGGTLGLTTIGSRGGHGLEARNGAAVRVARGNGVAIEGGNGGTGYGGASCPCISGLGGNGVDASGSSVLLAPGLSILPGVNGGFPAVCFPPPTPSPINGSVVTISPTPLPGLELTPVLSSPGGNTTFEVNGPSGAQFAVGVSLEPAFLSIPGIGGPLLLDPASLFVAFSGTLSPSGSATIPIAIPPNPSLSEGVVFFQPAVVNATAGGVELGPAAALVIL